MKAGLLARDRAASLPNADSAAGLDPWAALGTFGVRSAAMLLVSFLVLPIAALLWRATTGAGFVHSVTQPLVLHALLLTMITSMLAVGLSLV
ncbi:MAG: hypothetical protein JO247_06885, partial [Chloroflexi bacterium]|nr:hypothetical protein [Chloroflexota bacterium]